MSFLNHGKILISKKSKRRNTAIIQRGQLRNKFWIFFIFFVSIPTRADVGLSGAAPRDTVFTFRIRDEPETLDWNLAHTLVEADLIMNLMEGLVTFDANSKVVPALAKNWTVSPDGKIYTFKLRSEVLWTDGVALRAQDFVYSWKRLLSRMTAASYAYFLFDIEGAEAFNKGTLTDFDKVGIKALDDLTLEVKLIHPVAHWINIPAFWVTFPLRQDVVEKFGPGWETPGRMVTLGPYSLESHDIGSKYVLRANSNYFGIPGNINQVTAMIVKDDSEALRMYEMGALDFLSDLAMGDIKRLSERRDLKFFPQLKTGYLAFLVDRYPVSNVFFRRAIAMAIDKSKIKSLLFGGQTPASSFIPPSLEGASPSAGLPYDPIQAKKELRKSGITLTGLNLTYLVPNWDKTMAVAQHVQSELRKNLGLEITIQAVENKAYRTQLDLRAIPLFDYSWTADYPDPDSFLSLFLSSSGNSRTLWKNNRFDEGVLQGRRTRDSLERQKIYAELQKILLQDEAVIVPLYYEPNLALVRPRVKSLDLNSLGFLYLRRVNVGS